jgi:hypothetical protein
MLSAECGIEGAESLPDGTIFLNVKEVTGARAHLALGFLNEEGFGDPDVSGVLLGGHGYDVTGEDSVGGSDCKGIHNSWCFIIHF